MIKGKVTFVTSAAFGLGQAIALAFEKKAAQENLSEKLKLYFKHME